jgi:acetoin utilization protein AcuB
MRVKSYMSASPVTVASDASFHSALRLLEQHKLRRLPVVDASGQLIGMLTDRDFLLACAHYLQAPADIETIMVRPVVTIDSEASLSEAASLMMAHRIGGLPVIDAEQRLVGIITESDILKVAVSMLDAAQADKGTQDKTVAVNG